jgi:hypothetical protein
MKRCSCLPPNGGSRCGSGFSPAYRQPQPAYLVENTDTGNFNLPTGVL